MPSVAYYRAEAERCRLLAEKAKDIEVARQWRALARDYNSLADSLAASPLVSPYAAPLSQQPIQQQQAKSGPEDKT